MSCSQGWFEHHESESRCGGEQRCGAPGLPANGEGAIAGVAKRARLDAGLGEGAQLPLEGATRNMKMIPEMANRINVQRIQPVPRSGKLP